MSVKLKIAFDGNVPGIAEHKLDLASFGPALAALSDGLRRTAAGLVNEALEPQRRGPIAKRAELHVYLDSVGAGSLEVDMSVEPPLGGLGYNLDLIEELPVRAVKQFLGAVQEESKGVLKNAFARKFLRALPPGITHQRYSAYVGGGKVLDFDIGTFALAEEPQDLPALVRTTAKVVAVIFEPALEVRLDVGGVRLACSATPNLVDLALRLRDNEVLIVATVTGGRGRLIWLDLPERLPPVPSANERAQHLLTRWEETLERLSR